MTNKLSLTQGAISKHLEEMLNLTGTHQNLIVKSPEKPQKPPKPSSPPRIFTSIEPGKIHTKPILGKKDLPLLKMLRTNINTIEDLDLSTSHIKNFIDGGSRKNWLSSLKNLAKQACLPLMKEIVYNRDKCLEDRKKFKLMLKEYLAERRKDRKSLSPVRPPFLPGIKVGLDESKHKICMKAKEDAIKKNSNIEEMRVKVLLQLDKIKIELMRTVFLVFQLLCCYDVTIKDYINDGINKNFMSRSVKIISFWKEYSIRRIEKTEFKTLLKKTMENWKKSRIFLAFQDLMTYKKRQMIKLEHYKTILQYKVKKRICYALRTTCLKKKAKNIGKTIAEGYYFSRLLIKAVYSMKIGFKKDKLDLSYMIVNEKTKKKLKIWYQKLRNCDKVIKNYEDFYSDPTNFSQVVTVITKPLGNYKGLLEINRKSLHVSKILPVKSERTLEFTQKLNSSFKVSKNFVPNMFTLSVSNLKSAGFYQDLMPEGILLGVCEGLSRLGLREMIYRVYFYYKKLKSVPLVYHLQKAVNLSKDFKGTSEKIAEIQDCYRVTSMFYQKWKKKYCKKWLASLLSKFRAVIICSLALSEYSKYKSESKKQNRIIQANYETNYKKKTFKGFKYILSLKQKMIQAKTNKKKKFFKLWINTMFSTATRLENEFQASSHYHKKLLKKSFISFKKNYNLIINYSIFRVRSLQKYKFSLWRQKLQQKRFLRKVFSDSLSIWKERINEEFRSDSHMLAEIIRAWKKICDKKGSSKSYRIKEKIAENFRRFKKKIQCFFSWRRFYLRRKSVGLCVRIFGRTLKKILYRFKNVKKVKSIVLVETNKRIKGKYFKAWMHKCKGRKIAVELKQKKDDKKQKVEYEKERERQRIDNDKERERKKTENDKERERRKLESGKEREKKKIESDEKREKKFESDKEQEKKRIKYEKEQEEKRLERENEEEIKRLKYEKEQERRRFEYEKNQEMEIFEKEKNLAYLKDLERKKLENIKEQEIKILETQKEEQQKILNRTKKQKEINQIHAKIFNNMMLMRKSLCSIFKFNSDYLKITSEFHKISLKKKALCSLRVYYYKKTRAIYQNFNAYDFYIEKLKLKHKFPLNFTSKSPAILVLCFCSWKNWLNRQKPKAVILYKTIFRIVVNRYWNTWKHFENRTAKSLQSIFRDLELSLKSTCQTLSTTKKVRFNL
ncbi:hypothetical protein SteCoe_34705 [Stentor coeruleus]|uniref:Uncharacterized protein n=1 Tax=Stentor coeruleus TaxID=5963 RepID=A0A1R2ATY1_9CILI|nr:hypothetical protein SteCoe_34705 [Stentor coeruleus]